MASIARLALLCSLAANLPYLAGAAPAAAQDGAACPRTKCIDGVNACGTRWGGCYDECQTQLQPVAPPCTSTATPEPTTTCLSGGGWLPTVTSRPGTITTITPTPTTVPTICVDYINSCGTYGGCFASTSPWPTFTPPTCNTTTTTTKPTITTPPIITPTPILSICVDYINSCGMTYGGCFLSTSPLPTFTPPPCP